MVGLNCVTLSPNLGYLLCVVSATVWVSMAHTRVSERVRAGKRLWR
jgi:hypothetical protein